MLHPSLIRKERPRLTLEALEARHLLTADLIISEFQASNDATINDGNGRSSDWIEIYNPTDATVNLDGWYLTDDAMDLRKWRFPSAPVVKQETLELDPGEYLLVFASGQDTNDFVDPAGYLHTNFKLSSAGEFLALVRPNGTSLVHAYAPTYPVQAEDASYGLGFDEETIELILPGQVAKYIVPTERIAAWETAGFNDSEWESGETGIGYENSAADYHHLIESRVPAGTDSVYVRQAFGLVDAARVNTLMLGLRYDDGFVAYLNGHQVAAENAPDRPRWNSTATSGHPDAAASRFVQFDISEFADHLQDGENVLAIHALNRSTSSDMLIEAELTATTSMLPDSAQAGIMNRPTPGTTNTQSFLGFTAGVIVAEPHGFFSEPFTTALDSATADATIIYTTDGSEPTEVNGTKLELADARSISIHSTTVLRAIAVKPGYAPSPITTRTYLFPGDIIESSVLDTNVTTNPRYASIIEDALLDIPSVSLSFDTVIDNSTDEQRVSVEWLRPDGGEGFQIDAGIRAFGGEYTEFAKKNFRLYFRDEYGAQKLEYPVFAGFDRSIPAAQAFDQLNLRTGSHDMVMRGFYMSNRFTDDTMLDMGHLAPHGRFVHVYLNGTYWGQYHLRERWNADMLAYYNGGNDDDYEAINGNLNVGGWSPGEAYDGDGTTWTKIKSLRRDYESIRELMDVENYIDYLLLYMSGNSENEYRTGGTSDGESPFDFFLNDADGWLRDVGDRTGDPGPGGIMSGLVREGHPDFMMLLADRIQRMFFDDGVLTPERSVARLQERLDEVEKSFVVESARWGYRSPRSFAIAADAALEDLLPGIAANMIMRLRARGFLPSFDAPTMSQRGGDVSPGFQLELSANSLNTPGNNLAFGRPTKQSTDGFNRTGALAVNDNLDDFSHTATGDLNPYLEVDLRADARLDQIVLHNRRNCCPERLYNITVEIEDADGNRVYVSDVANPVSEGQQPRNPGSRLTFDLGEQGVIGRTIRVSKVAVNGSNSTEWLSVAELEAQGEFLVDVQAPGIYYTVDGTDPRLPGVEIHPDAILYDGAIGIVAGDYVKTRAYDGSTWSALNEAKFGVVPADASNLRITEIHYNPQDPSEDLEFVELQNIGLAPMDLTDVRFAETWRDSDSQGIHFRFPSSILAPGQTVLVVGNQAAFASHYGAELEVAGEFKGKLANGGELLSVFGSNGDVIQQLDYDDEAPWPTEPDGGGPSLEVIDPTLLDAGFANWQASSQVGGSPGRPNHTASSLRSDLNRDGEVGFADFLVLSANFGKTEVGPDGGDIDGDEVVSFADFLILSADFGRSS